MSELEKTTSRATAIFKLLAILGCFLLSIMLIGGSMYLQRTKVRNDMLDLELKLAKQQEEIIELKEIILKLSNEQDVELLIRANLNLLLDSIDYYANILNDYAQAHIKLENAISLAKKNANDELVQELVKIKSVLQQYVNAKPKAAVCNILNNIENLAKEHDNDNIIKTKYLKPYIKVNKVSDKNKIQTLLNKIHSAISENEIVAFKFNVTKLKSLAQNNFDERLVAEVEKLDRIDFLAQHINLEPAQAILWEKL